MRSPQINPLPRSERPRILKNPLVITTPEDVTKAYRRGPFYYQYANPEGVYSRVMVCDNPAERTSISIRVRLGQSAHIVPLGWTAQSFKPRSQKERIKRPVVPMTILNGEKLTSADAVHRFASQGPFLFQLTNPYSQIATCRDPFTTKSLAKFAQKRPVIARRI